MSMNLFPRLKDRCPELKNFLFNLKVDYVLHESLDDKKAIIELLEKLKEDDEKLKILENKIIDYSRDVQKLTEELEPLIKQTIKDL